jgi:hypothetical protein
VQQDVISAITQMNKGKANVMDAPVKHLFSIKVPPNFIAAPGAQPQPGQAAADPMGGNPDAAVPQMTQVSLSGRVSNALFDVIYFDLVVDVEVPRIASFLRTLEQSRLIGVREVNMTSVDSAAELAKGYYYGKTPVARLTLKCESMLMRKWTVPFMPPLIKQSMGIQEQPAAAATPTAMAQ